jgi:hypothetical protein
MDTRTFLGVQQSHNPFRWSMEVTPGVSTTGGFLFGGSGLGAAISALEGTSGRETIWATAQYLSYAKPGEILDIDVTLAVEGHQMTQARAVCHVGNREILTVNAALGDRPLEAAGQFERMPDVPPPDECGVRTHRHPIEGDDQRPTRTAPREGPRLGDDGRHARRRPDPDVGPHPRRDRGRRRGGAGDPRRLRADGCRSGARRARRRQQSRQHAATSCTWCRPNGCCSTSACMPSSAVSATASCTCSPRTAPCSRRPVRAASCVSGKVDLPPMTSSPEHRRPLPRCPTRSPCAPV